MSLELGDEPLLPTDFGLLEELLPLPPPSYLLLLMVNFKDDDDDPDSLFPFESLDEDDPLDSPDGLDEAVISMPGSEVFWASLFITDAMLRDLSNLEEDEGDFLDDESDESNFFLAIDDDDDDDPELDSCLRFFEDELEEEEEEEDPFFPSILRLSSSERDRLMSRDEEGDLDEAESPSGMISIPPLPPPPLLLLPPLPEEAAPVLDVLWLL